LLGLALPGQRFQLQRVAPYGGPPAAPPCVQAGEASQPVHMQVVHDRQLALGLRDLHGCPIGTTKTYDPAQHTHYVPHPSIQQIDERNTTYAKPYECDQ
jgi:hypothetical protein